MVTAPATTPAASDSMMVGDALAAYWVAHELPPDGGAADPVFHVRIGPFTVPLPNPPGRRRAVVFHDVNHLVTGYNTTFSQGEMIIAGFEVGARCGPYSIVWYINLGMMALGILFRPRAPGGRSPRQARRWTGSCVVRRMGRDRRRGAGRTTARDRRRSRHSAPPRDSLAPDIFGRMSGQPTIVHPFDIPIHLGRFQFELSGFGIAVLLAFVIAQVVSERELIEVVA